MLAGYGSEIFHKLELKITLKKQRQACAQSRYLPLFLFLLP